jgi:hypothetical protein
MQLTLILLRVNACRSLLRNTSHLVGSEKTIVDSADAPPKTKRVHLAVVDIIVCQFLQNIIEISNLLFIVLKFAYTADCPARRVRSNLILSIVKRQTKYGRPSTP